MYKKPVTELAFFVLHLKNEMRPVSYFLGVTSILICFTSLVQAQHETVEIPEPLMFDLVRGLGAKQGELEINTLADFPLNNIDERAVEWAPEIEYALFDGFAIELEFPFKNEILEAFKFALQYTIGQSDNSRFIHGLQFIGEIYRFETITELSLLYIPAYRFDETWSVLGMFGLMYEVGANAADDKTTLLLNTSVFANLNEAMVLGLEINNTDPTIQERDDNSMEFLLLPQFHYEFESGFSFQVGLGPRFKENTTEYSGVLRVIQTF